MTDVQKEALALLAEVWDLSPDVRLGQLMAHLGFLGEAHIERGLGYIEDDELIAILYRHRAELLARCKARRTRHRSPQGPPSRFLAVQLYRSQRLSFSVNARETSPIGK